VDRTLPALRSKVVKRDPFYEPVPPLAASSGIARADLLIFHGATRLFFPYFHVVGDGIDGRLLETLASVDARPVTDRSRLLRLLQRFSEVLKDGHGFTGLMGPQPPVAGYFPVTLEQISGEPVIRRSLAPGVNPGDTLVSVAGRPIAEWLAEEQAHTSAATPGYLHDLAMRRITALQGPTVFGLRGVDGTTRTVVVQPQPVTALRQVGTAPSRRAAGSLVDLGAPLLHYINLSDEVMTSAVAFRQAVAAASGAMGLVVDMRGYPGVNPYEVAARLIPWTFSSPIYRYPRYTGPDQLELSGSPFPIAPLMNPSYAGPIVLLVGPRTVSAAETFSTMLTAAGRATVIGRRSAATNGNLTRLFMPGVASASFTGMEVLNPDGSRFHGVGIVPQLEVEPTAADLAEGRDAELLRAIQFLQTGQ
jgi:C-terminal processing protease CtpA/Prc